ncbi:molybdenum ABC transporter substrate-binding protein [Candidatus Pacearchaeota archaeon]|nr:MAG: molybdenum ABC transporter substrate-binding protein [Candidatus Pacearchaeota archaeon]
MGNQEYPEIPPEREDDLHNLEIIDKAQLILFMAGNQFMVMDELIKAFQRKYPEVEYIFYETLPPGLEFKQIIAQGALFKGKLIPGNPDIYTCVTEDAMKELLEKGLIEDYSIYLHNRIVLMVPEGNPANIKSVLDLGRDEVRVSQPGEMEHIAKYIIKMYEKAGGKELVKKILEEKKEKGTTIFTKVHHRETPERIIKGEADVGPVWATEVEHAKRMGLKVEAVEPGEELDMRDEVNYYIAKLKNAPNPENAEKFLKFIFSEEAQKIYQSYGFVPHKI